MGASGEVDPDVARCRAKRHHVEHAGFRNTGRRSRPRARRAHSTASSGLNSGVVRLGSKRHRGGCHLCHIDCAGSNPGRTALPHVELQRRDGDGGRVVAAACFRRPEQEDSKSNSSRTPGPSRALSQSR
jgi:hypothetical protein